MRVRREVDPRHELSAMTARLAAEGAVLFERVRGGPFSVVVGTDGTRERIARFVGTDRTGLLARYRSALEHPLAPIEACSAPVQAVAHLGEEVDLRTQLPQIVHYEGDVGPAILSGVVLAAIPEQGIRNLSFHRLQVVGPREIGIAVFPRHLAALLAECWAHGSALPVTVAIGSETAIRLAAATWGGRIALGYDEIGLAGALRGTPVELAPALTVAGMVLSQAEVVIEGEIVPERRTTEGPFAECTGYYSRPTDRPVIRVSALTHRPEPLFQDLLVGSDEHLLLQGLPQELVVHTALEASFPGLRGVNMTHGGCGKFHATVSVRKQRAGEGKEVVLAALAACRDLKLVVVVDDDVDPFNQREVEWAVATRFQADRDLVVISGACGNPIDPSAREGTTAKMGMDATRAGVAAESSPRARIPYYEQVDITTGVRRPTRSTRASVSEEQLHRPSQGTHGANT